MFRLAYVPGVTPSKWVRIWQERLPDIPLELLPVAPADAGDVLCEAGADAGLVRLPVDRTRLSAIPLYTEATVAVVPKDHVVTAVEEVTAADLADEVVLHPLDDVLEWPQLPGRPALERPATTEDAVELVAAGVGVLLVPQSLARLHHRRDLTYRPVTDAPVSAVVLAWPEEATTDLVEDFIGIVRGRTANSTRGRRPSAADAADARTAPGQSAGNSRRTGGTKNTKNTKTGGGKNAGGKGAGGKGAKSSGGRGGGGGRGAGAGKRGKPGRRS